MELIVLKLVVADVAVTYVSAPHRLHSPLARKEEDIVAFSEEGNNDTTKVSLAHRAQLTRSSLSFL